MNDGSYVIDFVTSTGGCELYYFIFDRVELKTIHLSKTRNEHQL